MENLSATIILAIKEPELLFTGDPIIIDTEYKQLRILWHPDQIPEEFQYVKDNIVHITNDPIKGILNNLNPDNVYMAYGPTRYDIRFLNRSARGPRDGH